MLDNLYIFKLELNHVFFGMDFNSSPCREDKDKEAQSHLTFFV